MIKVIAADIDGTLLNNQHILSDQKSLKRLAPHLLAYVPIR